jgi:hypothetical protein
MEFTLVLHDVDDANVYERTNCMELITSSVAVSSAGTQELPNILWNQKCYYRITMALHRSLL